MPRRSVYAVLAALACAGLAALVWVLAFHSGAGHRADNSLLQHIERWEGTSSYNFAEGVASLCNAMPYAVLAALVVTMAAGARGTRGALVITAMLVVPNLFTQLLKHATATNRDVLISTPTHIGEASWPSGHSTAAMALALCAILAAPAGFRALAAIAGLGLAFGVGLAVVMIGWHYPSDVLGGYLIAGAGACVGAAVLDRGRAARVVFSRPAATAALPSRSPRARG
jgi:membrane-associated phospholipid phosphatase